MEKILFYRKITGINSPRLQEVRAINKETAIDFIVKCNNIAINKIDNIVDRLEIWKAF